MNTIWWHFNKKKCLREVKYDLLRLASKRTLKNTIVISIIQHVIDTDREKLLENIPGVSFNPMNDSPLILHILENYELLKPYPGHRYHIRTVLKKIYL